MSDANRDLLRQQWRDVSAALGIEFVAPVIVDAHTGERIEFACLLPQFGTPRGMLIDVVAGYIEAAREAASIAGFRLSTMAPETRLEVRPADFIECLVDWGWTAEGQDPPNWYVEALANGV
jgi:hypothetical protein